MCGIVGGYAGPGAPPLAPATLQRMLDRVRHRGPDDEGSLLGWRTDTAARAVAGPDSVHVPQEFPFAPARGRQGDHAPAFVLGHRRLSIRDLSAAGHQPMCTPDRRYWLAFNGEIYNAEAVARHVGLREPRYGTSDTEVLLRGYAVAGEAILEQLNGMFAMAIWDDRDKSLFLARDRLGIKPLYLAEVAGAVWFASEIKALLEHPEFVARPDWEVLYHALGFGPGARPGTWFEGVRALPQAHWMRIDASGGRVEQRYWSPPLGASSRRESFAASTDRVESLLAGAVQRRLVSDVPVGIYLSGGMDSGLVAACAREAGAEVTALTLALDEGDDEAEQAAATANHLGIRHEIVRVSAGSIFEGLDERILWDEEPGYGLGPNNLMGRMAREHGIPVVLNGLGGDELFAGYSYYEVAVRWRWVRALATVPGARALLAARNPSDGLLIDCARPADIHSLLRTRVPEASKRALFPPERVPAETTASFLWRRYSPVPGVHFMDAAQAVSYMDLMNYIGNHHLVRGDQYSMRHSVEARFPFLDHTLVEYALTLPTAYKIRRAQRKRILRRLAGRRLPADVLQGPKRGFSLPMQRWLRGPLREFVHDMLSALDRRGIFVAGGAMSWWRGFEEGRVNAQAVWQLAMMEQWFRTFIDPRRGERGAAEASRVG